MRLFQSAGFGRNYLSYFNKSHDKGFASFVQRLSALLHDRYDATHILKPVYDLDPDVFFTVSDDFILQSLWAKEHGIKSRFTLDEILLAQIEEFQPDVLYQLDPITFPSSFVRRLPSCVKKVVAWRAAPLGGADLSEYDLVVSNFQSLNAKWRELGLRTDRFSPSWDPEMFPYSTNSNRSIDVFFTGSYARTTGHDNRLLLLDTVSQLEDYQIDLRLISRKWGRFADMPLLRWIPVPIQLPKSLTQTANQPVYGRKMYELLSQSRIVLNPATDIAGDFRGNMRCWEALGCGACMLGSAGLYPEGFHPGENFESFTNADDLTHKIKKLLADEGRREEIAKKGRQMLSKVWSKERQWNDFQSMVARI